DRAADQRKHSNQVVGKAATKYGRPHAGGNADDDRNDEGRERKLDRGGERVEEVVGHRAARADASTEIAVDEAGDIGEVLLGQWPVEVVLRSERLDLLVARVVAERRGDRIRGNDMGDREGDDRNPDHHRRDPADPPGQEPEEPHGALVATSSLTRVPPSRSSSSSSPSRSSEDRKAPSADRGRRRDRCGG